MKIKNLAYATFVAAAAVAIVIGSAVPSEAAKKKKAAAAPPAPQPVSCLVASPGSVCATKGGQKFTYFNTCYAAKGSGDGCQVGRLQGSQGRRWQEEKEDLITLHQCRRAAACSGPFVFRRIPNLFLARRNLQQLGNLFFR